MEAHVQLPWIGYYTRTESQPGDKNHSLGEWRYLDSYQVVDIGQLDASWVWAPGVTDILTSLDSGIWDLLKGLDTPC